MFSLDDTFLRHKAGSACTSEIRMEDVVGYHVDDALADQDFLASQTVLFDPDNPGNQLGGISFFEHQNAPVHGQIVG